MVHVKTNYKSMYGNDLQCSLCQTGSEESQGHLLVCPQLVDTAAKFVQDIIDKAKNEAAAKLNTETLVRNMLI